MIRKLIALLVLITGLAAMGQPAQARIVDLDRTGFASFSANSACATQADSRAANFAGAIERDVAPPKGCPKPPKVVVIVPTVMLQADRARE